MKLKLNLIMPDGQEKPTAVTADATATIGEIARTLQAGITQLPVADDASLSLQLIGTGGGGLATLPGKAKLSETSLRSGQSVQVVPWEESAATTGSDAAARLHVLAGPNAGESFDLRVGPNIVGREDSADVTLADHLVSRRHARIIVAERIEIVDMNSANGVIVGGEVLEHAVLGPRDTVVLGDSTIMVEADPGRALAPEELADLDFNRSPLVRKRYEGKVLKAPTPPGPQKPVKPPIVQMIAPLLMGIVLFSITRNPLTIAFICLSPLLAVGSWVDRRSTSKKEAEALTAEYTNDLAALQEEIAQVREEEERLRNEELPSLDSVVGSVFSLNQTMWHRRPEAADFLHLNLGYGTTKTRNTFDMPERGDAQAEHWQQLQEVHERAQWVSNVSIGVGLREAGSLGLAGKRDWLDPVARGIIAQLVALHSPAEVILGAVASHASSQRWQWLMWLPHVDSSHSPLGVPHLAATATGATALVTAIEEVVAARKAARAKSWSTTIVLLVEEDAPAERGRLVGLAEHGPEYGVHLIWLAPEHQQLPAACHAYLVRGKGGKITAGFVKESRTEHIDRVETLSETLAQQFARQLSPSRDASAPVVDESDLPRAISYLALTGTELAHDPQAIIDQWRENNSLHEFFRPSKTPATLRGLVGQGTAGEFTLDLRTQGPHALVGGTTGAGKSEFLQSWVLGMAASHSPQRITFLFVDYKGGAAFADCVELPHTVGLVTDLSPHLVRRALTSLRAELHYREHLLNAKRAKDLISLERTGDPQTPPSLIIVVDEFAALVNEVPEFVDGVVDVAQRGRSLGLHLILATQRPAGVIKANLRANTNLRVALRMADEADSTDVLDSPLAAEFDPRIPGRGAVRTGPGRIALFQTGYAGGRTSAEVPPAQIEVEAMAFGPGVPWEIPTTEVVVADDDEGPTDIARVVDQIRSAATQLQLPAPRRPWLPELPATADLDTVMDQLEAGSGPRIPLGIVDDPAHQSQHVAWYDPQDQGNFAVFGASGAGKSAVLRTLAVGASMGEEPVHIYGIEFGSSGLSMLTTLPTVGAILPGDDTERVGRLLRKLIEIAEDRTTRFAQARAGSLSQYREATSSQEPRILLLVDGFGPFREQYETTTAMLALYAMFTRLLGEGRALGIHVMISADRYGSIPTALGARIQQRLVLRQVDENAYMQLNVPKDVLTPTSPPGRGVLSGEENELQVAVPAGEPNPAAQSERIEQLAHHLRERGISQAPGIEALAEFVPASALEDSVGGWPVLGINEVDLQPMGFDPQGAFLVAGMQQSGRTTTLLALAQSLRKWDPNLPMYYFGPRRSAVHRAGEWAGVALDFEEMKALATQIKPLAESPNEDPDRPGVVVMIESLAELVSSPAEAAMVEVIKLIKRNGHLVIGENETSGWTASWPVVAEVRNNRRGIVMAPDQGDGDLLLRSPFPRVRRADFPPGRGIYAMAGKNWTVQIPFPGA